METGGCQGLEEVGSGDRIFFQGNRSILELYKRSCLYNTMNVISAAELDTLKWIILCEFHLNYIKKERT